MDRVMSATARVDPDFRSEPSTTDAHRPARFGNPPRRPLVIGLLGALMLLVGGFGAGGVLVRDPLMTNSVIGFWRYGHGHDIAAFLMYGLTGAPIWAAIGQFGAWVNLFNLMPVWQLDGAHAFTAMDRRDRWLATAAAAVMFFVTREGLLVLVAIFAGMQAVQTAQNVQTARDVREVTSDRVITAQFIGLVVILSWMAKLITPDAHL